ncbi:MAG: hypothetical protein NC240_03855 [Clostridium sp.]|nr:hypothetical protein [Clostridium sp.]
MKNNNCILYTIYVSKKVQKNDYIALTCIQFEIIIETSSELGRAKYNGGIALVPGFDTNSLTNFL